jgi:hypothetical protein
MYRRARLDSVSSLEYAMLFVCLEGSTSVSVC